MPESVRPNEAMVNVRLVADRDEKDDCQHYTPTVWRGQGDVQPYPLRLWPKLAEHPDVWELTDAAPPSEADMARAQKDEAAGSNTDLVIASANWVEQTPEMLEAMPDIDIHALATRRGYALHPRLNPVNLRKNFLAAQEAEAAERVAAGIDPQA